MAIVKKLASGASSLVQVLTGIVGSIMFLAVCSIQTAAKMLAFCAETGLVSAVLRFVRTLTTTLGRI